MKSFEIFSLIVTLVCLISFSLVFTILFRNYNLNAINDVKEGKDDIDLIDDVLLKEKRNKRKTHKIVKTVQKVTYYSLYGAVLLFFCFSLASRILGNNMLFGNTGMVVIASGSMSMKNESNKYLFDNSLNDQIDTYDIIGIEKYQSASEVKLYDIIAFKDIKGRTIVHRIISLTENQGELEIITRGDSQNASDNNVLYEGTLSYDEIIGRYNHVNIPLLGSFVIFLQSNSGIITIVAIGYCVLMFDFYRSKLDKAIEARTNTLIELIDYDIDNPNVNNYFKQELIYKGFKYIFSKGDFIEKVELSDEIKNQTNTKMYSSVTLNETNNSKDSISVKNIENNEITKISIDSKSNNESLDNIVKNINTDHDSKVKDIE